LLVDGVSAGTFTKSNDFIISNIGKAYFGTGLGAKVDIKEVVIHYSYTRFRYFTALFQYFKNRLI
jgi:hypothetical protein